ncbi:uncharacterized protein LOC115631562 [Scaptodrosophila lebanonensis]|uniref:Uncharacterized protein LOC115631562 n=1 Tax=Drosophila lebanonensis TaxID=7225 RepID=A0A6J2U9N4_DROLE|nr:uncharacterized protein LOC115631562 [Scaptodrosophila lebanonensis]
MLLLTRQQNNFARVSRGNTMDNRIDNFQLIAEVFKRQALWDTQISMTSRKDICGLQWQEVADIMNMDVTACRKRFKSLRDCYRNEIRKIQRGRMDTSNWPYFRALEFLRRIFDPENLVQFPVQAFQLDTTHTEFIDDFIVDVQSDDSLAFDVMDDIFQRGSPRNAEVEMASIKKRLEMDMNSTVNTVPNTSGIETSYIAADRPPPPKRGRKSKSLSPNDEPLNTAQTTATNGALLPEAASKGDADYNFLISLLPHLKSLSDMGNLKFRLETSRILMDLKREDIQDAKTPREIHADTPTGPVMPRLIPAPAANYARCADGGKYTLGSCYEETSPLMVECDVKIENEALYKD